MGRSSQVGSESAALRHESGWQANRLPAIMCVESSALIRRVNRSGRIKRAGRPEKKKKQIDLFACSWRSYYCIQHECFPVAGNDASYSTVANMGALFEDQVMHVK